MPITMPSSLNLSNAEIGVQRRRAILTYIRGYQKEYGFAPSQAEIAEAVGLASKNAVRRHLDKLIEEGKLTMSPGKYRTLRVVPRARA